MRLNLGAGNRIVDKAINHDLSKHREEIDVVHDLNVLPWPFADGEFKLIYAIDVFEHLTIDLVQTMNECHRILAVGGEIIVKYPLNTSPTIHDDPTHRWHWSSKVFDYFDDSTDYGSRYGFYTPLRWRIVARELVSDGKSLKVTLIKL